MQLAHLLLSAVLLGFLAHTTNGATLLSKSEQLYDQVLTAVAAAEKGDHKTSILTLRRVLAEDPNHTDANQIYASVIMKIGGDLEVANKHFRIAAEHQGYDNPYTAANHIEALRLLGRHDQAHALGQELMQREGYAPSPDTGLFYYNLAMNEAQRPPLHDKRLVMKYLDHALEHGFHRQEAWKVLIEALCDSAQSVRAEAYALKALQHYPSDYHLLYLLGTSIHQQKRLEDALKVYQEGMKVNNTFYPLLANLAAVLQGLGRVHEAVAVYEHVIPLMPENAGVRNNFGSLLGSMGKQEEEVYWLQEALKIDPYLIHAIVNLAGYYQDEGLLVESRAYLSRAVQVIGSSASADYPLTVLPAMRFRDFMMLSPVVSSWNDMLTQRLLAYDQLCVFLADLPKTERKVSVESTLDRIHFYIQFHGLNDFHMQDLIADAYQRMIGSEIHVADQLAKPLGGGDGGGRGSGDAQIVRIGFISKFFGIFEPHGMLLDGIITHLPRHQFHPVCLPVARSDSKPLAGIFRQICSEIHEISLVTEDAMHILAQLQLDVLVFADTLGEPINHFLAHNRCAAVQVAFWGNPVTTGSAHMDYFISSQEMESAHTKLPQHITAYSEQVVLLDGQGIHYYRHVAPELVLVQSQMERAIQAYSKASFNLSETDFVYLMPQSVFKIHPLFDLLLVQLLASTPARVHILLTAGRRAKWTQIYTQRLQDRVGPVLAQRLHVIERVSSENFYNLLRIADVVLHPFPFDGSRTSADALILRKPYVTLPTEYLRGRMGYAFLRTMNIPELVAKDARDYLRIALALFEEPAFLSRMVDKLAAEELIWEDMQTPFGWTAFLQRAMGLEVMSYEAFLQHAAAVNWAHHPINVTNELARTAQRDANTRAFDAAFVPGDWQMEDGQLVMEDERHLLTQIHLANGIVLSTADALKTYKLQGDDNSLPWPRVFAHWRKQCQQLLSSADFSKYCSAIDSYVQADISKPSRYRASVVDAHTARLSGHRVVTNYTALLVSMGATAPTVVALKLAEFRRLISEDALIKARAVGQEILQNNADQVVLLEYALTCLHLGLYAEARRCCLQIDALVVDPIMVHSCLTVTGLYAEDSAEESVQGSAAVSSAESMEQMTIQSALVAYELYMQAEYNTTIFGTDSIMSQRYAVAEHMQGLSSRIARRSTVYPRISVRSLEINVFSALKRFRRLEDLLEMTNVILGLHSNQVFMEKRYAHYKFIIMTAVMALVDWLPESLPMLSKLQGLMKDSKLWPYDETVSFLEVIAHVQDRGEHVINIIMAALASSYDAPYPQIMTPVESVRIAVAEILQDVSQDLILLHQQLNGHVTVTSEVIHEVVLVQQYFLSSDAAYQQAIDTVLTRNLHNQHIARIYLLTEELIDLTAFEKIAVGKITQVVIGERLTFARAFQFANEHLGNKTVILANADIYFDSTAALLSQLPLNKTVLALLKWQYLPATATETSHIALTLRTDSQDAWIFRPPMSSQLISQVDFYLGLPRCDNRLAYLLREHGYHVLNPALSIRSIEFPQPRSSNSSLLYSHDQAVLGEGSSVTLTDRMQRLFD